MSETEYVVLDFETTGLAPPLARIIEVGAVKIKAGKIIGTYQQLVHPGTYVPSFITEVTGITNAMLKGMPPPKVAMTELHRFVGDRPIIAHNASFDSKFYFAEMDRAGIDTDNEFICTLMLARRLIESPDYKLTTLVRHLKFKVGKDHLSHRALFDAEMTVQLWNHLEAKIKPYMQEEKIDSAIWQKLMKKPKASVKAYLEKLS